MSRKQTPSLKIVREGIRWGAYDFGNSAYYLVFVAFQFPLFLREHVFAGDKAFETKWGLAQGGAVALSFFLSLALSRFTDRRSSRKYWSLAGYAFGIPALLSFAFPLLIGFSASPWTFIAVFFMVHGIYLTSLIFYDASLMDVSGGTDRIEISGWAWGWGYVGGVICLILLKTIESRVGYLSWPYFATASGFFLVCSVYASSLFKRSGSQLKDESDGSSLDLANSTPVSAISTLSVVMLLGCMVLIVDGIAVFIGFMSLYWNSEHFSDDQIFKLMLLLQLLSFPFSGFLSMLARKGVSFFLILCGVIWLLAGLCSVLFPSMGGALLAVVLVSIVLGASQAVLRTIFSEITTPGRRLFGFSIFALFEEGAAFIGPILAGLAINVFGYKVVLTASAVSILIGSIGLAFVTRVIASYAQPGGLNPKKGT